MGKADKQKVLGHSVNYLQKIKQSSYANALYLYTDFTLLPDRGPRGKETHLHLRSPTGAVPRNPASWMKAEVTKVSLPVCPSAWHGPPYGADPHHALTQ